MFYIMKDKTYHYKKLSHFEDALNINNKQNNIISYTNEQFEEDLKKWNTQIQTRKNNKINNITPYINEKFEEDLENLEKIII